MKKIYKVGGLNDEKLAADIEDNISLIDGILDVAVDLENEIVLVDFDENVVEMDLIESTLTSLGYGIMSEVK